MPLIKRLLPALALCALAVGVSAPAALASTTQESIIQDDHALEVNPVGVLQTMRDLGATRVKLAVNWNSVAPDPDSSKAPKGFNATDPGAYPAAGWAFLDGIDRQARADGLKVGFLVGGPAPAWAIGAGAPRNCSSHPCGQWKPSATDFEAFVKAVGKRYSGTYKPAGATAALPRVSWYSIWNEPNYGPSLAPQATDDNTVYSAAIEYRALLNAAWSGLASTGHKPGKDTILIGETAPRGIAGRGFPGNFSGTKPLIFLRALYCVSSKSKPLTGATAAKNDCPTSKSKFRSANPALFQASGYAAHLYAQGTPPNVPTYACGLTFCFNAKTKKSDPDYADFAEVPRLESTLDKLNSVYGSRTKFPIWNTEFGYWTNPPDSSGAAKKQAVSPTVASYYMNWSEYLSYRQSRLVSYSQYLLIDPPSGAFADGFLLSDGQVLPTYDAYSAPLYMPTTSAGHASSLLVWGGLRAASAVLAAYGMAPHVQIQFAAGSTGAFATVQTVTVRSSRGYFEVHQAFTESGEVRLAYTGPNGQTLYSRTQAITIK